MQNLTETLNLIDDTSIVDVDPSSRHITVAGKQRLNLYHLSDKELADWMASYVSGKDTMILTQSQLSKINQYKFDRTPVALPTFVLTVKNDSEVFDELGAYHLVYEYEEPLLTVTALCEGHVVYQGVVEFVPDEDGYLSLDSAERNNVCFEHTRSKAGALGAGMNLSYDIEFFLSINHYLSYYEGGTEVEEKWAKKQSPTGKSKKKKGCAQVRLVKQYTLKRDWKKTHKKHKHPIMLDAWGVRGHLRHYASGKVVFIKAYIKGKHKDKYISKEYKIV